MFICDVSWIKIEQIKHIFNKEVLQYFGSSAPFTNIL